MGQTSLLTKSIRLNPEENAILSQISQEKGISEAALMKQFVMEGIAKYRLEQAVAAYIHGEADISAAARYAGVSVYWMMKEIEKRNATSPVETEKFVQGLNTLVELFGGSNALRQTIAEFDRTNQAAVTPTLDLNH